MDSFLAEADDRFASGTIKYPGTAEARALEAEGWQPWLAELFGPYIRAGYADRVVTLDQNANAFVQETLQPLAPSAPSPPPAEPTPPSVTAKRGKKGRGPKGAVAADSAAASEKTQPSSNPSQTPTPTPTPKPKDETSNGRIQVVD